MFWTFVGAILFVTVVIPLVLIVVIWLFSLAFSILRFFVEFAIVVIRS